MSPEFTIEADGDSNEQRWWPQWTRAYFPSYETFWRARIVPLTYRVKERQSGRFQTREELASAGYSDEDEAAGRFQTREELASAGYSDEDVAIAQLHYTVLMHLGRVFDLLDKVRAFTFPGLIAGRPFGGNEFFESFARLSGASDVAGELLARRADPGRYGAWNEADGAKARRRWREKNPDPLRLVRDYRNRLVHGRVVPELLVPAHDPQGRDIGDVRTYPRLEKVNSYLDWRVATAAGERPPGGSVVEGLPPDFDEPTLIARDAWERVVHYVEDAWQTRLVPAL